MIAVGEKQLSKQKSASHGNVLSKTAIAIVLASGLLSACSSTTDVFHNGYVMDEQSLQLIPEGSSREQVLLTMGTPSTTATFGNEVIAWTEVFSPESKVDEPRWIANRDVVPPFGTPVTIIVRPVRAEREHPFLMR